MLNLVIPVVLIAILDPAGNGGEYSPSWATPIMTFDTADECMRAMPQAVELYRQEWPQAMFWCADPVVVYHAPSKSFVPPRNPRR